MVRICNLNYRFELYVLGFIFFLTREEDLFMKRLSLFHSRRNREKPHGAASRSQALLEFALAVPILLMLLFGIIDLAALFSAWLSVENIARQTVRYAVTGQYDPAFCVDGPDAGADACAGDDWEAEQDAARLLSVQEYANRQTVALFHTPGAAQDEIGHINITVCSSRDADDDGSPDFTFYAPTVPTYGDCQQGGVSTSDAGAPGDRVIIAVDYNHPYITPIFNQTWPMTHLFSQREGIVEQFRVPRLISLPPLIGGPTLTPSNTPPPTATGTATASPTATNTPLPLYIEIINPEVSGVIITSVDQTRFEAVAWDPNIGTTNGTGIDRIDFWFTGPSHIPGRTERQIGYCAFSGNAPCQRIDAVVDYTTLANGTYTMYARARGSDGRYSEIVSKEFILQFPATATATITNTPTSTAVPTCDDLSIVNTYIWGDDFRVTIRNSSTAEGYLVGSTMTWNSPYSPPVYFDYFWFRNTYSSNQYYNPSSRSMYSTTNPVISWSDPAGAPSPLAGAAKTIWGADFVTEGYPMAGNYAVTLTIYLPDVGNCILSTSLYEPTPPPTNTPQPTSTPRPTDTPGPTSTPWPTRTPRPTNTYGPSPTPWPTSTPRPTNTPGPPTPTRTPAPPTNTPDATATPTICFDC